jgi:hypothetical protein
MSKKIIVSTRKGLFTVQRNGASRWGISKADFVSDNVTIALPDPRDGGKTIFAALNHGHFGVKLHRSRDGGASWTEVSAPAYPKRPEGAPPDINPMSQQEIPWTLKLIWALEPGGSDQASTYWCGTIPGGLFRSDDRGDSWQLIDSLWNDPKRKEWFGGGMDLPGIHSIAVHPNNSNDVLIAISCGGAWRSLDGGKTWAVDGKGMRAEFMPPEQAYEPNIQDAHRLVQCNGNPNRLWVQHHNGIFRSDDRAQSRSAIETVKPNFGFAVAVPPTNPDIAWFVPGIKDEHRIPPDGKVVVTRTTDGGKTFEHLRSGLPQEHAYDIVYRHCLDIDETGNTLAMGSTTGSLWVTEDGGDAWSTISTHLPPIYAVRFV